MTGAWIGFARPRARSQGLAREYWNLVLLTHLQIDLSAKSPVCSGNAAVIGFGHRLFSCGGWFLGRLDRPSPRQARTHYFPRHAGIHATGFWPQKGRVCLLKVIRRARQAIHAHDICRAGPAAKRWVPETNLFQGKEGDCVVRAIAGHHGRCNPGLLI